MSQPEIPGFYFDVEKNRYFKITNQGQYSKSSINNAKKFEKTVLSSSCSYLNKFQMVRQFERQMRYNDGINPMTSLERIATFRQIVQFKNLHCKGRYGPLTLRTSSMLYDREKDLLIQCTNRDILSYNADYFRRKLDENLPYNRESTTIFGASRDTLQDLKFVRGSNNWHWLSFISEADNKASIVLICSHEGMNDTHFESRSSQLKDYSPVGEHIVCDNLAVYSSRTGLGMLDLSKNQHFKIPSVVKSDILSLDWQGKVIGSGNRKGDIYLRDTRVEGPLKDPIQSIGRGVACCKFQFFTHDTNKFLVNGTNDKMVLFDMRNLQTELVNFENYHSGDVMKPYIETVDTDRFIMVKDEELRKIRIYDASKSKPISDLAIDAGSFVNMKSGELCILDQDRGMVEYWCV